MNRFNLGFKNLAEQAKTAGNKLAASATEASSRLPTFGELNSYSPKPGRTSGAVSVDPAMTHDLGNVMDTVRRRLG